jgi:hypothetical protein
MADDESVSSSVSLRHWPSAQFDLSAGSRSARDYVQSDVKIFPRAILRRR